MHWTVNSFISEPLGVGYTHQHLQFTALWGLEFTVLSCIWCPWKLPIEENSPASKKEKSQAMKKIILPCPLIPSVWSGQSIIESIFFKNHISVIKWNRNILQNIEFSIEYYFWLCNAWVFITILQKSKCTNFLDIILKISKDLQSYTSYSKVKFIFNAW